MASVVQVPPACSRSVRRGHPHVGDDGERVRSPPGGLPPVMRLCRIAASSLTYTPHGYVLRSPTIPQIYPQWVCIKLVARPGRNEGDPDVSHIHTGTKSPVARARG